jgi:hypothetical protein
MPPQYMHGKTTLAVILGSRPFQGAMMSIANKQYQKGLLGCCKYHHPQNRVCAHDRLRLGKILVHQQPIGSVGGPIHMSSFS